MWGNHELRVRKEFIKQVWDIWDIGWDWANDDPYQTRHHSAPRF